MKREDNSRGVKRKKQYLSIISFIAFFFFTVTCTWNLAVNYTVAKIMSGSVPSGMVFGTVDGPSSMFYGTPGINIIHVAIILSAIVCIISTVVLLRIK